MATNPAENTIEILRRELAAAEARVGEAKIYHGSITSMHALSEARLKSARMAYERAKADLLNALKEK
ncbi:MAG: hypothetical protein KKH12_15925 [Gammaproteobacteria bacterium]|nr:hypothetical protein [Gammaproteobacteria bacterium]